ncbi:MAG: bifunctional folylpolyglutamate synthase/dihydrofolate synthase [bacterium]
MKVEEFLNSLVNYEKIPGYKYDLEAFKEFLKKLDSPQERLKNVILIAGTKGKGSTATIINSCLITSGYKVGLFTSPHLLRITERIKINNKEITEKEMEKYIKVIKPYINFKTRIGARTFFETLATIAYMYFAEKEVDFAVLEVGVGGRLDATNVFNSHIPVITRIGYDHMNLLGNKLSQIALEKAGIIPDNKYQISDRVLITIHQRPVVEKTFKKIARQRNHKIVFADDLHKIKIKRLTINGMELSISGALGEFDAFLPITGEHQIENLQIALSFLFELRKKGIKLNIQNIIKGIKNARFPGRFEILSKKPLIVYDVAHNEDSFKALKNNLNLLYNFANLHFLQSISAGRELYIIFGCNKDKDINYAIKNIFTLAEIVLLIKADNPRAMEPLVIYEKARKYQKNIIIAGSMKNALGYAIENAGHKSVIVVFGSFYLYADLIRSMNSIQIEPYNS